MGADERCPGDGVELTAAVMEDELHVRKRLEAAAETRFRLADTLGDRTHPPAVERVEVQDAICLAEPERAEHDRFGRVRPGHQRSLGLGPEIMRSPESSSRGWHCGQ